MKEWFETYVKEWFYNQIMDPILEAADYIRIATNIEPIITAIANFLTSITPWLTLAFIILIYILGARFS